MHIVARARLADAGRFSLRITPGGFGTPDLAGGTRRVRVVGAHLVVEDDTVGAPVRRSLPLAGATWADLAALSGVDLAAPLDVGHDTTPAPESAARLVVDAQAATDVCRWLVTGAAALDHLANTVGAAHTPTPARLWPEHFDVAVELQLTPTERINLGVSPGDGFCDEPYAYAGPWTSARPGSEDYWNAPFGAMRTERDLDGDLVGFWAEAARRFTGA